MIPSLPAIRRSRRAVDRGGRAAQGYWIGHYGCGRLVKVATSEPTGEKRHGYRLPKVAYQVDCPACGYTHRVKVAWRLPKDDAELDRAELSV